MSRQKKTRPRVWAFGGGKGGVGRSLLATGVGWHLGRQGCHVLLVDADPCGVNLHACLGIRRPPRGEVVETEFPGLHLLSGVAPLLSTPYMTTFQKKRYLMSQIDSAVDVVIIDLGAGPATHIADAFCFADLAVLVLVPEPTAVERTYSFLRHALIQRLRMRLPPEVVRKLRPGESSATGEYDIAALHAQMAHEFPQYVEFLKSSISGFKVWLALNGVRMADDIALGHQLVTSCVRHLEISASYAGYVHQDEDIHNANLHRRFFMMETPTSIAAEDIRRFAENLFRGQTLSGEMAITGLIHGDHYQILGLPPTATLEHVEKAYRYLIDLYEEGSLPLFSLVDSEEARHARLRIKEAYEVLRHPVRRLEYDTRRGFLSATESSAPPESGGEEVRPAAPLHRPRHKQEVLLDPVTGAALRAFRESRAISLAEIAEKTKVAQRYLEYIEQDRHKFLPAPVYLRGFLQEYARIVGLDPRRTAESYLARISGSHH
jgi:flagellar biosynthesis protein FlhG